jgi:hypothetical protein
MPELSPRIRVPQIVVRDVWSPRASSEGLENFHLLWPSRGRIVQGRVCGRVEWGDIAVKVIRTYSNDNLRKIIGMNYWACSLSACPRTDMTR